MKLLLILTLLSGTLSASEIQWTRFRGKVKAINYKTQDLMLQNNEGDMISLKVTDDVAIFDGKEVKKLGEVSIDEKVSLLYAPKPVLPKDSEEPAPGGVYK